MLEIITATSKEGVEYVYMSSPTAFIFVSDITKATKFYDDCDVYIDVILAYLRTNFKDYGFRVLGINSLFFDIEKDDRLFDKSKFDLEAFND